MFLIAQVFGILSAIATVLCVQARTSRGVLFGQILANGFSALSYGLLGSFSGAWICFLGAIHSWLIAVLRKGEQPARKKWLPVISVVFALGYVAGSVATYSGWPDLISCFCALLFVIIIAQEDASKMRNVMLLSMSLWVVFDIVVGAYANILTHGSTVVSILTAKLRLDKKK